MAGRRAKAGTKDAIKLQAQMDSSGIASGFGDIEKAVSRAAFRNLREAAFAIRGTAARSIKMRRGRKASKPGDQPFTHKGAYYRRAIWYHADQDEALIGFRHSKIGRVGATHEHGLSEGGRDYPERPTMAPALRANVDRFHRRWRASI